MEKNIVIVGAQWGDEGKGKIIDFFAKDANYIVRYQGGHNAGHTLVVNGKTIVLHILPSGILHNNTIALIANGVVLSPEHLINEINMLEKHNYNVRTRIIVSELAHLVFDYHISMDVAREKKLGKHSIGTTKRGIGPAYEDKIARRGLRLGDLHDWEYFSCKLKENVDYYNFQLEKFYNFKCVSYEDIIDKIFLLKNYLIKISGDVSEILKKSQCDKKFTIFEGAQGSLLDIDHGTYPYVTSSSSISGSFSLGSGIGPCYVKNFIGVVKAYSTRVGNGPFPTEIFDELDSYLCKKGNEFGATTGRKRRIGWLDTVLLKKSIEINSFSQLCLTKIDVLDGLKEIKICVGYKNKNGNVRNDKIPRFSKEWTMISPIYEVIEGWNSTTSGIINFEQLPYYAKKFIFRIEEILGIPISIVSTGPNRSDTIIRCI
ncbi:MAG: adenylosuccinate synthase [Buchnera aphidicola (Nurudea yanoniella)]